MLWRHPRFILLLWFAGVLCAEIQDQPCPTPRLSHGYFIPYQETYSHGTQVRYACEHGYKAMLGGWWATSTCQNGKWSVMPQCIDEKACFPPTILNARYNEENNAWYMEGATIRITCDAGYEHKDRLATAKCRNGTWYPVPVCHKSTEACTEPPQIPHAVITDMQYKELFPVDSQVQYQCEDGYTIDGRINKKTIICISGNWTPQPKCIRKNDQGNETSPGRGGSTVRGSVRKCKGYPAVPNGVAVDIGEMYFKYQCPVYYKLEGPDVVSCVNGTWSQTPVCKPNYCLVKSSFYPQLIMVGDKFLENGQTAEFECVRRGSWMTDHFSKVTCIDNELTFRECCSWLTPDALC